jgi:hypothetical protein
MKFLEVYFFWYQPTVQTCSLKWGKTKRDNVNSGVKNWNVLFSCELAECFYLFKVRTKNLSIGDAQRETWKWSGNWKLKPYCQGIRRMRIGIPVSSANIRRGIPIFCPLITRERFWLVSRSNDNLKTAWIETKSIKKPLKSQKL